MQRIKSSYINYSSAFSFKKKNGNRIDLFYFVGLIGGSVVKGTFWFEEARGSVL